MSKNRTWEKCGDVARTQAKGVNGTEADIERTEAKHVLRPPPVPMLLRRIAPRPNPPTQRSESNYSPNTNKINVNIQTKRLLERDALLPARFRVILEHLVRKWHLLLVPCREQAYLVDHPCQCTSGVRAPGEAEDTDFVPGLV